MAIFMSYSTTIQAKWLISYDNDVRLLLLLYPVKDLRIILHVESGNTEGIKEVEL